MPSETVLITGASSGIGLELARCFAADGSRLALVARSSGALESLADELRRTHKIQVHVFPLDLARPEAPTQLCDRLQTAGFKVDVLVNNAGFGANGSFVDLSWERQMAMVQVNLTALTHLSWLCLPRMVERQRGGILNVASTASFVPGPGMAIYFATKAYVLSFSEAIREELRGTGVAVTALCPGPTTTNFFAAAGVTPSRLFTRSSMSAASVARIGHRAFREQRTVVLAGWRNRILISLAQLAPRAWVRRAAKSLNGAKLGRPSRPQ